MKSGKVTELEKLTEEQRRKRQQENEEKKEYLQSYKKYKQKAKRLEEQLEELRLGNMFPSLVVSDMPGAHDQKDLSDYMVQYDRIATNIIKARNDAITRYKEVREQIERLEDENEKTVLTLRYLRSWKWEKIALELNVGWTQIHKIHSNALKNFNKPASKY